MPAVPRPMIRLNALRGVVLLLFLLIVGVLVTAQPATRDYAIVQSAVTVSEDNQQILVDITVTNQGADATANAPVEVQVVNAADDMRTLATDELGPLAQGDSVVLQFELNVEEFPPATRQQIRVSVGVDDYELAGSDIADDNVETLVVDIPDYELSSTADDDTTAAPLFEIEGDSVRVLDYEFTRTEALVIVGAVVGLVLLIWILSIIFRLIFRRPPTYGVWQPAYSRVPTFDPNSTEGRRQAWQGHAYNSLLLGVPTPGNIHPVKHLLGADSGKNLDHWRVKAIRLSQYTSYGRVEKTQQIASQKWVKRLNKAITRNNSAREDDLLKQVNQVARGIAKPFLKRLSKKNAYLPIAMDVRFEGKHGDVRIVFELYQCEGNMWQRIDHWEPTMSFIAEHIEEEFVFTLHGRVPDEPMKQFKQRLQEDLTWLLMETIRTNPVPQRQNEIRHDEYNVPDTLSGMEPIKEA